MTKRSSVGARAAVVFSGWLVLTLGALALFVMKEGLGGIDLFGVLAALFAEVVSEAVPALEPFSKTLTEGSLLDPGFHVTAVGWAWTAVLYAVISTIPVSLGTFVLGRMER